MASNKPAFVFRYALRSFAIVFLAAFLLRAFLISSYSMAGSSMLPTVWPGDFIVAVKAGAQKAGRGSVVAAQCPSVVERICLKRVAAVAGDRIEIMAGQLMVNGQPALYPVWPEEGASVEDMEAMVVAPDQVFLLNDRRSDTDDSRTWGPVPRRSVAAKAIRVWVSLDWFDQAGVRSWPRVRWDRLWLGIN